MDSVDQIQVSDIPLEPNIIEDGRSTSPPRIVPPKSSGSASPSRIVLPKSSDADKVPSLARVQREIDKLTVMIKRDKGQS